MLSLFPIVLSLLQPNPAGPEDLYVRSRAVEGHAILETSTRTFKPSKEDGRPTVHLVGVIHVGEKAYYGGLQEFLDAQDLVLYEAVKPASEGETATTAKSDGARTIVTRKRLRLLAVFLEKYRAETNELPASLEELAGHFDLQKSRIVKGAMVDAWGTPVRYRAYSDAKGTLAFDLTSLGADQQAGGEGPAADVRFADQRPLTPSEIGANKEGMQAKLASALGLEFQLATMNYERSNWRNSDLSIEAVQRRLEQEGASGDALIGMLEGTSFPAMIANIIMGFVKSSPAMQASAKLMMIETLANADDLLGGAEGPASGMMKVIIVDRNEEVFRDLARVIREEPQFKTVAIFYGAGHLQDMEKRLTEMDYRFESDRWFAAIDLDLKASGLTEEQADATRKMIKRSIEGQKKRTKPAPPQAPSPSETPGAE